MTHSWRNISWCSRMLLSGVSGPLFGIWHRVVGGQAIRSPRRSEIQECCNLGSEMCRASDLSVGTDMFACFCHGKCTYVEAERGESPPGSTQHHIIKLFFFFLHTLKGEPLQPSLMAGAHGIAFLLEWLTFSGWAKYFGEAGSNKNCFRSEVRVCCGCFEGKLLEAWLDNASSSVRGLQDRIVFLFGHIKVEKLTPAAETVLHLR